MTKCLLFSLLSLVFLACGQKSGDSPSQSAEGNAGIVGGKPVHLDDPYRRSLIMIYSEDNVGNSEACTGTFIAQDTVLTAAHCVSKNPEQNALLYPAGIEYLNAQPLKVTKIIIHEGYFKDGRTVKHDVALIKFSGKLPNSVKLARLADSFQPAVSGMHLLLLGYGVSSLDFQVGTLKKATAKVPPQTARPDQFVMDQKAKLGVCFGDSGSPAFISQGWTLNPTVIGVASVVEGPSFSTDRELGDCYFKSRYMQVSFYAKWIAEKLKQE